MVSRITLLTQGSLVKISKTREESANKTSKKSSARRGKITSFSRKSRKRLLELMAKLDMVRASHGKPIIFITLTYGQAFPTPAEAKKHLWLFIKRLRRFAPDVSGVWRYETQKRGAPHFHLLLFSLPFLPKEQLALMWASIIGLQYWDTSGDVPRLPFTRIESVNSGRRAFSYVSKYVAKVPNAGDAKPRGVFFEHGGASASGFNTVPYLDANLFGHKINDTHWVSSSTGEVHEMLGHALPIEHNPANYTGRHWGIINGDKLPYAEAIEIVLDASDIEVEQAFYDFRRSMAKKWRWANKYGRSGASIFAWGNSRRWYKLFLYYLLMRSSDW